MWFVSRYFSRHGQRVLSILLFLIVLTGVLYWILKFVNPFNPTHTEGIIGTYTVEKLPARVTNLVSVGLTRVNSEGNFEPQLATWTVDEEGKTYTFTLKDNTFWQDGKKVVTSDLVIAIEGVTINYPNEKTIEFKLNEPFSPFPSLLSKPIFRKNTLVGAGKYKIKKLETQSQNVSQVKLESLEKNLPNVDFNFYHTEDSALTALKLGQVDAIYGVFNHKPSDTWPNWQVEKVPAYNKIVTIFFNTKDQFLTKEARLALNYLIDRSKYEHTLATSTISPTSWAYNPELKHFEKNVEKANELVKDLNLENQKVILSTLPQFESVANMIANDWRKLLIEVEVKVVGQFEENYQVFLAGQEFPIDPDQYTLWHSTQKTNITKLSSPRIDKLLEDGRKLVDPNERKQKYHDFQKVLIDESPAIFLYFPDNYFISRRKVTKNVDRISTAYPNFKTISD